MRIFAKLGCLYLDGMQHKPPVPTVKVIDMASGKELRWCRLADDQTGEFERFTSRPEPLRSRGWLGESPKTLSIPKKERGITPLLISVTPCPNPSCSICGRFR